MLATISWWFWTVLEIGFWVAILALLTAICLALRSWAVWYLAREQAEIDAAHGAAIEEHNARIRYAIEMVERTAYRAERDTYAALAEFLEIVDPRWTRPAKAAKVLARARTGENPREYLAARAADPFVREAYLRWRATQTKRRAVSVG